MNGSPPRDSKPAEPIFGYLMCLEDPAHGFTGGYLIVSQTGRPLEFHCTAPVTASRAQEILFGPTLRPYLIGEQIGRTLLRKATLKPTVLVINDRDAAAAIIEPEIATVLLPTPQTQGLPPGGWRPLEPHDQSVQQDPTAWTTVTDGKLVAEQLALLAGSIDISEPFERIEQAIREAQRLGRESAPQREESKGAIDRDAA